TTVDQKYRKKIVFTPFHIQKSYQAEDINGISDGFPKELLRRMETQGKFLTRMSPYPISSESMGANQDRNLVKQVASMSDSQFVVSGEVIDVGDSDEGGFLGFFKHKRRRFDVEVFVYDGLSGAMIARHEIQEFADGDVSVDRNRPIASTSFFSTTYGQAISKSIDAATALISWDLEDIPLTARVIRVVDGKIYIDAGSKSSMTAGDKMLAYKLDALWINELGTNTDVGAAESLLGTISILQVEPMYSICKIQESNSNLKMKVGDLVRVVAANQRNAGHSGSE
ncbi:MAG TPA: flagella assembly protein FlgT middle domain-containing protein, partial [Burkholderiaceae bacterium]|nr:flagella assembly protein FlgT middle domain-containing protein [Burkholderiaceae bacterium]